MKNVKKIISPDKQYIVEVIKADKFIPPSLTGRRHACYQTTVQCYRADKTNIYIWEWQEFSEYTRVFFSLDSKQIVIFTQMHETHYGIDETCYYCDIIEVGTGEKFKFNSQSQDLTRFGIKGNNQNNRKYRWHPTIISHNRMRDTRPATRRSFENTQDTLGFFLLIFVFLLGFPKKLFGIPWNRLKLHRLKILNKH